MEFTSYKVVNITNENTEAYLLMCLGGLCIKTTTALARKLNLNSIFTVNQMIEDLLLCCIVLHCTVQIKGSGVFFGLWGLAEQQDPNSYVNHTNYLHTLPHLQKLMRRLWETYTEAGPWNVCCGPVAANKRPVRGISQSH